MLITVQHELEKQNHCVIRFKKQNHCVICVIRYTYTYFTLYTPYGLNERTNFMNKDSPTGRPFPPLPRCGERFTDTRTQSKITNHDLSSGIDIFKTISP